MEFEGKAKIKIGPFSFDISIPEDIVKPLSQDTETRKKQLLDKRDYYQGKLEEVENELRNMR